jgi:hypothetical protein
MDLYHIALFVHITALLVASGATAVMKLAMSRRSKARTLGEVADWHAVMMSTSKLFPMMLAVFVLTGSYMLSVNHVNAWATGFVVAGLTGVVLLLVSGVFLGTKGKAMSATLEDMIARNGADHPAPVLVPPPFVAALPIVNTFIALSVAFDMVTKPASIHVALSIVAGAIALGFVIGMRRPTPAPTQAPAS